MAQNVIINGVTYQNVPAVDIPKATSGTARFMDTSDATLASGDEMLSGVTAYSDGVKVTGSIATKTSADLTANGATVSVPAGYYASAASKAVATGEVTAPSLISGHNSDIVISSSGQVNLQETISVTPRVTTAGYVSAGTAGSALVKLQSSVNVKGAQTYTPGTTNQTIAPFQYLTDVQTILGDANLVAGNIVSGVSIFGVSGSATLPSITQDSTTKVLSIS